MLFSPFVGHYQLSRLTKGQSVPGNFVELVAGDGNKRRDSNFRCIFRSLSVDGCSIELQKVFLICFHPIVLLQSGS